MVGAGSASVIAQVPEDATVAHGIGFDEALRVWARIALLSFGGPAGQILSAHDVDPGCCSPRLTQ